MLSVYRWTGIQSDRKTPNNTHIRIGSPGFGCIIWQYFCLVAISIIIIKIKLLKQNYIKVA